MQVNMHKYRLLYNTEQSVDSIGAQKQILWIDKKKNISPKEKTTGSRTIKNTFISHFYT